MVYYGSGMFNNVINMFQQYGILDVALPFLLIFTIIYAVLDKFGPFKGEAKYKYVNVTISTAIGILSIVPHIIGGGPDIVAMMQGALPQVGLLIIAIILLLVIMGVSGKGTELKGLSSWAAWVPLAILALIFANAIFPAYMPSWMNILNLNSEFIPFIVALAVMGLIIYFVVGSGTSAAPKGP